MIGVRQRTVIFLLAVAVTLTAGEIRNKGWWRHTVFYQIYPRSFMDSNADGVGDLKGITQKLSHFVEAGIGAIWLSPINRSPMVDFGYDIADFKDVDLTFGSLADFRELVAEAKKLGIKVILDLVPNHSSHEHFWFEQSVKKVGKYKDYYIWVPGNSTVPPNNWISVFSGPAWTYHPVRREWYFHQFEERQPDLNYRSIDVKREMEDVIRFWLQEGVDGFRIDAVPHIFENVSLEDEPRNPNAPDATPRDYTYLDHTYTKDQPETYELIKSWRKIMDDYASENNEDEKVMMTEAYTDLQKTALYYSYGAHVPFNFKFIIDVNAGSSVSDFKKVIDDWMIITPAGEVPNWVMGNHDRSRTASRYPGRADQMTMLAMILPGVAVTYNGEEIGMLDKRDISWADTQDPQACNAGQDKFVMQSRDPNRTPFQWDNSTNAGFSNASSTWLPVHENYKELNLAKQRQDQESHYKIYTALTNLRKTSYALRQGSLKTINRNDSVLVIVRDGGNETVALLINFSDTDNQTINLSQELRGKLIVKVASLNSKVAIGTQMQANSIQIPAKASIVIYASGAMSIFFSSFTFIVLLLAVLLF